MRDRQKYKVDLYNVLIWQKCKHDYQNKQGVDCNILLIKMMLKSFSFITGLCWGLLDI